LPSFRKSPIGIWAALEHRKAEAELRANGERLAFLLRLNDAVRRLSDPAAIQETAARQLCEHLGAARVGYAETRGPRVLIFGASTPAASSRSSECPCELS
jgi:hypothetical protein